MTLKSSRKFFLLIWLIGFQIMFQCLEAYAENKSEKIVLNIRVTNRKVWFILNGKSFKKTFSLRQLKRVLGEPDSINIQKGTYFKSCLYSRNRNWRPKETQVFYSKLGLQFSIFKGRKLEELRVKVDSSVYQNVFTGILLLNGDTMRPQIPSLDIPKILALDTNRKLTLDKVLVDDSELKPLNWKSNPLFEIHYYAEDTSLISEDMSLNLRFNLSMRIKWIEIYLGDELKELRRMAGL